MSHKFAANLNFLFTEGAPTILDKLRRAREAGFRAVEIPYPSSEHVDTIAKVKKDVGVEVALMNIALDKDEYAFGSACIPGAEELFKKQLDQTISLANSLNCKKIHIMSGLKQVGKSYDESLSTYIKNLTYAAKRMQSENIIGVIEPINKYALAGYFMNSYDTAIDVIHQVNSPNLKLMVDIFHLQHICGNITNALCEFKSIIGHMQIAQVPHRHEPDIVGELDFDHVFRVIEEIGYKDWIGCEYKPKTTTAEGIKWISKFGFRL